MNFRTCLVALLLSVPALGQTAAPPPLPQQQVVFVIDNSASMEQGAPPSDPLRLRGVAAGLILDALELASNVTAGLVLFSDDARAYPPPVDVRTRLQANQLPRASGGTNMKDGLEKAIAMLSSTAPSAPIKRIVLITDGMPNPGQETYILQNLVPHAANTGIQIFAIGLSRQINQDFLDNLTGPTGGRTLMSEEPDKLLESAKEVVGDLDNVFRLGRQHLAATTTDYEFDVPQGVDRARLTAILDQPQAFKESEITFTLSGGTVDNDHVYNADAGGSDRVAAWTGFFSTPGHYKLHVDAPGGRHRGMHLFVEALSNLRVQLSVNPPGNEYAFGQDVVVDAEVASSSGSLAPSTVKLSGVVRIGDSGGTIPIVFNGREGKFKVPDVAGRHTIIVTAQTPLAHAQAKATYQAARGPIDLKSDREALAFGNMPLGPANPQITDEFRVLAICPPGTPHIPVNISFTTAVPLGRIELLSESGSPFKAGVAKYTVPAQGLPVKVRMKMDPDLPLPDKGGKYEGTITISSNEAPSFTIPYSFTLQIPKFELTKKLSAASLWWDPERTRVLSLGNMHTDYTENSRFFVTLPEAVYSQKAKLVTLDLRAGGQMLEADRKDPGKLHYGPIELPAGQDVPLDLVITPAQKQWREMPRSREPFEIQFLSSMGMHPIEKPEFVNLGGKSWYGHHVALWLMAALLFLSIVIAYRRLRTVWLTRRFLEGSGLYLGFGGIRIGADDGSAALLLPNTQSSIDDSVLGRIEQTEKKQLIQNTSQRIEAPARPLKADDQFGIFEVDQEGNQLDLWGFEYLGYDPAEQRGEVTITRSPLRWTIPRVLKKLAISLLLLLLAIPALGTDIAAWLAYHIPIVERLFYIR